MLDHPRARRPLLTAWLVACALSLLAAPPAQADPEAEPEFPPSAYTAAGTEVSGGASIAEAPAVEPGRYRDSFDRGEDADGNEGTTKLYRVKAEPGERVHAAATITAPPPAEGSPYDMSHTLAVTVEVVSGSGEDCTAAEEGGIGEPMSGTGPVTATAVSGALGPEDCRGEEFFVVVTRSGTALADQALPVEVQIALQPAGLAAGEPSVQEALEDEGASPVAPADPNPVVPGRSFADPLEVGPGSVVLELSPGDAAVLAIPVQQGQRLRWRTELTAAPEAAGDLGLLVHNSVRDVVTSGGGSWGISNVGDVVGGGMAAPIALGNRGSEDSEVATAWLPGTHYVVVTRLPRTQLQTADLPQGDEPVRLILTLAVEGEAEDTAEDAVLDLGSTEDEGRWARYALLGGAGALGLLGVLLGAAGLVVLRRRNR